MDAPNPDTVPRHPIGVVVERTGLSAHVLRAWERRYAAVRPGRGEGGRRLYSDADVERLALVHSATRVGRSVASVVALSAEELRRVVAEDAESASLRAGAPGPHREAAMVAVRDLVPERLGAVLRRALLSLGCVTFLEDVVSPLMVEIGEEWHAGRLTIAQEHAATAAVLQLLGGLSRDVAVPDAPSRLVIATPRGEAHSVGAMMAAAVAAHEGWRVTWLGPDLPAAQIAEAAERGQAHLVALGVVTAGDGRREEVRALRRELGPHVSLCVGGAGAGAIGDGNNLTRVRDLTHWRSLLRREAS